MEDMEVTGSESTESVESSGATTDASGSEAGSGSGAQAQAAPKQEIDWEAAFNHPRFKSLVDQKNDLQQKYQTSESRYAQLEAQFKAHQESLPKPPTEMDAFLQTAKGVDPAFAKFVEQQMKVAQTAEQLQKRLETFENQSKETQQRAVVQSAVNRINALHAENKIPDYVKRNINNHLDAAARSGRLNISDLKAVETAYREELKSRTDYEEAMWRERQKSYQETKAKDTAAPSSLPKGAQAKPASQAAPKFKTREEAREAMVQKFIQSRQAAKEATNS